MITLNRLGHSDEPFQLNPDMVVTVESTPDTVITLATGAKVVVAETPQEVAAALHAYRADVLSEALRKRRRAPSARAGDRQSRLRPALSRGGRSGLAHPSCQGFFASADEVSNESFNGHWDWRGFWRALVELDDGRDESRFLHKHPRADDHHRRHLRCHARQHRHGGDEAHTEPLQTGDLSRTPRHARTARSARGPGRPGPPRRSARPRRPALGDR